MAARSRPSRISAKPPSGCSPTRAGPPPSRSATRIASATATPATGIACALARNVLAQDAGTRYIHICQHGWDHHKTSGTGRIDRQSLQADRRFRSRRRQPDRGSRGHAFQGDARQDAAGRNAGCADERVRPHPGPTEPHGRPRPPQVCLPRAVRRRRREGRTGDRRLRRRRRPLRRPRLEPARSSRASRMWSPLSTRLSASTGPRRFTTLPSGRTYVYVDPLGANGIIPTDELSQIYGS